MDDDWTQIKCGFVSSSSITDEPQAIGQTIGNHLPFDKMGIIIPALCTWQSCSENKVENYFTCVKSVYQLQKSKLMLNPVATLILFTAQVPEISKQAIYGIISEINFIKEMMPGMTVLIKCTKWWHLHIVMF